MKTNGRESETKVLLRRVIHPVANSSRDKSILRQVHSEEGSSKGKPIQSSGKQRCYQSIRRVSTSEKGGSGRRKVMIRVIN